MTLNRAQRRAMKQSMRRRAHATVTLRGGPMDGWIVQRGAPALEPDWRARYLEEAAIGAGRYALRPDGLEADWVAEP